MILDTNSPAKIFDAAGRPIAFVVEFDTETSVAKLYIPSGAPTYEQVGDGKVAVKTVVTAFKFGPLGSAPIAEPLIVTVHIPGAYALDKEGNRL